MQTSVCGVSAEDKPLKINECVVFQRAILAMCGVSAWITPAIHRLYHSRGLVMVFQRPMALGLMDGGQARISRQPVGVA
jgi:hypothetical protein